MLCKNVFLLPLSIMLRRLFDYQNFIVLLNFFSMFEKSWEYAKKIFTCFFNHEKVIDRLSNFGEFCERMALMVGYYMSLSHFMVLTVISWLGKYQAIKGFHVSIELHQGCVLFPLFFIVFINWFDKCSQADMCVTIGNCKISCLLFAGDLILLPQNLTSSAH